MEPEWNHSKGEDDASMLGLRNIQSKIAINLNKDFDCSYICKYIFKMLDSHISKKIDLSNCILCIELKNVTDENTVKYIENRV